VYGVTLELETILLFCSIRAASLELRAEIVFTGILVRCESSVVAFVRWRI
jgi:hypothetical protein